MKTLLTIILFLTLGTSAFAAKVKMKDLDAFQMPDPTQVDTWRASLPVEFRTLSQKMQPGEWIVFVPGTGLLIISDAEFQRSYSL